MTAVENTAPRASLLDKDLVSMSEDELRAFVLEVRAKRNSQQLAHENKPTRKPRATTSESPGKRAKMMADLLGDDED